MQHLDGTTEAELHQIIGDLQGRLAKLEATAAPDHPDKRTTTKTTTSTSAPEVEQSFGRRALLRKAGVVAAGAVALTAINGAQPAAAANGSPVLLGGSVVGGTNTPQTLLKVTSLEAGASSIFAVTDGTNISSSRVAAVSGVGGGTLVNTGIAGVVSGADSVGVLGQSAAGTGLAAASNTTHLKLTDAAGSITSYPTTASILARTSLPGEIIYDRSGNLWLGTSASVGGYRKLAGASSSGAFHVIAPTRRYDSRPSGGGPGPLTAGTNRLVQITNGSTIPTGARAILGTLTITETTGVGGFLTITAGDVISTTSSSINWSGPGQTTATTVVSNLDSSGRIKMFNNAGADSQFILDVTGYFI
jgi:hypothetical protein